MADVDVNFPGPSPWEQKTENPYSSTTTKELAPSQAAVQSESLAQAEKEKATQVDKTVADVEKNRIETAGAAAQEEQSARTILDKDKTDNIETAKIAKRAETLRLANDAIRAQPAPALFADSKGWDAVRRAISLGVAGIGDAMMAKSNAQLGRQNGPSAVTDIINMDLERQRAIIKKLTDAQVMAKEGVKDAMDARELALSKIDLRGAAMLSLAKQHMETQLRAHGMTAAQVAGNEAFNAIDRAEIESKKRAVAGLATEHTNVGQKVETTERTPPTDGAASKGQLGAVKNPDGSVAGPAPAAAAAAVNEATVKRSAAIRALKHFHDQAAKSGGRELDPSSTEFQELKGAYGDAVAAVTSVTNMPGTDKSSLVEAERLGPPGTGLSWKVNPKLIKRLAGAIAEQGRHAIQMTANSAIMTSKAGKLSMPELPASPAANSSPGAAGPGVAAPITAPAAPPVMLAPPPAAPVAPATQPMVPPRVPGNLSPKDREALQWAYGPGRGTKQAEDIKRSLGVK